jgi:hypothetical protein
MDTAPPRCQTSPVRPRCQTPTAYPGVSQPPPAAFGVRHPPLADLVSDTSPPARGVRHHPPAAFGVSHRPRRPPKAGAGNGRCQPSSAPPAEGGRGQRDSVSRRLGVSHPPLAPVSAIVRAARRRRAWATRQCQSPTWCQPPTACRRDVSRRRHPPKAGAGPASDIPCVRIKKGGDAYKHLRPFG